MKTNNRIKKRFECKEEVLKQKNKIQKTVLKHRDITYYFYSRADGNT